jgi:dGTPase
MTQRRNELERAEGRILAPYAQLSAMSRGRQHDEEPHSHRKEFQRDRDRIVHSRAFRRLEYKSQVFLNGTGDHYRTRLTHTIEVAAIARSLARTLQLNEDLAEAISLAHDLGHPPFGHPGEEALNRLMENHGGFEHNQQSLRVVEELELKYPEFNGLNLTWEVREGLAKPHRPLGSGQSAKRAEFDFPNPSLEAQVADAADEIAYVCHDLDDGLEAGFLDENALSELTLWETVRTTSLKPYPQLEPERARSYVLRCLLNYLVADAATTSSERLEAARPSTSDDARRHSGKLIGYSAATQVGVRQLREFLDRRLYHHPEISNANQQACRCLEELFRLLVGHPHLLGAQYEVRVKKEGIERATCNYLAGMTDRYALEQHKRLIGGERQSLSAKKAEQPVLL